MTKRFWLVISGIQWLAVGVMLLVKGLRYLIPLADQLGAPAPLLQWLVSFERGLLCEWGHSHTYGF